MQQLMLMPLIGRDFIQPSILTMTPRVSFSLDGPVFWQHLIFWHHLSGQVVSCPVLLCFEQIFAEVDTKISHFQLKHSNSQSNQAPLTMKQS